MTNMAKNIYRKGRKESYEAKPGPSSDRTPLEINYDDDCRKRAMKIKKKDIFPLIDLNSSFERNYLRSGLKKIDINNESRVRAQKAKKNPNPIIVSSLSKSDQQQKPFTMKALNLDSYSEDKVTPQILCSIVDMLCDSITFLYIEGMALYVYTNDYYQLFSYSYAGRFLRKIFRQHDINYAFRTSDYKEIVNQLQAQESISLCQEDCQTNVSIIQFSDGAFEIPDGKMRNARREHSC